jgi:hypothetical protein
MLALTAESYISAAATNTTRAAVKQTAALQRCRLGVASRESLALASDQTMHKYTVCALGNLKIQSLGGGQIELLRWIDMISVEMRGTSRLITALNKHAARSPSEQNGVVVLKGIDF